MSYFKQMLCTHLYKNHLLGKGSIMQLGYDPKSLQWLYIITCVRCDRMAIISKLQLNKLLEKDDEFGKQLDRPDKPESTNPPPADDTDEP